MQLDDRDNAAASENDRGVLALVLFMDISRALRGSGSLSVHSKKWYKKNVINQRSKMV
jgi:hypothetical protein